MSLVARVRLSFVLLAAIAIASCASAPVPLLTGPNPFNDPDAGIVGCYTNFALGELVVDPDFGTAISGDGQGDGPVRWPTGYTGRRSGSEVEVVDTGGHVIARTGNRYQIEGAFADGSPRAWLACGYVLPK